MPATVRATVATTLPADDRHPYRSGAWRPQHREWDATDLPIEGELPTDLSGVYLRNTENPVHESIGRYHPFDGDGMLHQIAFHDGRASYRNRFVRTDGFLAEQAAAESLWTGMLGAPEQSKREDGWGAHGRMKDASSTDVVVHHGQALTSFWQCGDLYALDPHTLEPQGKAAWAAGFPSPTGISAHPKVDERNGELLVFGYGKEWPYLHLGVVSAEGELLRTIDVELPGPRLPHDMAFTEHYAILNDLPLFWDPELLAQGVHLPRFFPDVPSRFAIVRRDGTGDVRWFEGDPTYVLHWINAYEDGDEVVLDGFFQHDPSPAKREGVDPHLASVYRYLDLEQLQARPHRWRFDLATGQTKEEPLSDRIMEFGMVSGAVAGRPHRYSYNVTGAPGWFLFDGLVKHDLHTGREERYAFDEGVFGSETPFAPRPGATAEDDGYLVTFTTDVGRDLSECLVFDATDLLGGPIARVRLPERISAGTHSCCGARAAGRVMGTVAITGSAGGIGSALRARLEGDGHRVIGIDVREADVLADLVTPDGRAAMVTTVTEQSDGALDGLVAAAGVTHDDGALVTSINYFGAVATLAGLRPLLADRPGASAVAVSSNSTTTQPGLSLEHVDACLAGDEPAACAVAGHGVGAYGASKLALARWVRRQAVTAEWIGAGIRLNAVAPGFIATPMTAGTEDFIMGLGDIYPIPIGRAGQATEVADLLAYLLSPAAGFFCGSVLTMDGGTDAALRADAWPAALP